MGNVPRFVWLALAVLIVLGAIVLWVEHVSIHVH